MGDVFLHSHEADRPAVFFRWRGAEAEVSPCGDHGAGKPILHHEIVHEIGGVSLGDASEIELHVCFFEGDGLVFGVENEVLPSAA